MYKNGPCSDFSYLLTDTCSYEPVEVLMFPAVDPKKLETPVAVTANDGPLLSNKINLIALTTIKNTLLPTAPAEGDTFVAINQTPKDVTIKVAAADTAAVATLRPGAVVSMRYVGGAWSLY
jgi:hypothetical protein